MSNTEQILTTAVGATIGFFIGGPLGALQGAQYGLLAGGILFPAALPPVTGPRLEDFQALKADPGSPIPLGWGTFAVQGFYLYAGEPIEHATTEEVGGKGGGGQEVTTFSYTQTLAVGICEGPIEGISRIWENGKLVYDGRPKQHGESEDDYQNRLAMSAQYADTLTLYLGSEDQEPDPTLEAELGAGAVPAFRGLAYIVFPDRQLQQDQGLRHPIFKFEISRGVVELDPPLILTTGVNIGGFRSEDGETYEQVTDFGGVQPVTDVAYSPSLNRLVAAKGAAILYSDDRGKTWTSLDLPGAETLSRLCWSDDLEIFCGFSSSGIPKTSPDGLAWTEHTTQTPPTNWTPSDVIWCPGLGGGTGLFVAGSSGSLNRTHKIRTSPDGETWTTVTHPDHGATELAYDPVNKIAIAIAGLTGSDIGHVLRTEDGETWTLEEIETSNDTGYSSIAFGQGKFVICHGFGSPPGHETLSSTTGAAGTWTKHETGVPNVWEGIAYAEDLDLWVMVGSDSNTSDIFLVTSPTGTGNWTKISLPNAASISGTIAGVITLPARKAAASELTDFPVSEIVSEISERCGLDADEVDATELEDVGVTGYCLTRETTARAALEPLRMVGLFDIVERDEQIVFRRRGGQPVATLTAEDLGAYYESEEPPPLVTTVKTQDVELPRQIRLRYQSIARDYEPGEQLSPARHGTVGVNDVTIECPVALEDDQAAEIAEILFREAWAARWQHQFVVDARWHSLEPADIVLLPVDGRLQRVRITTIDDQGLMLRRVAAVRDDDGAYVSVAVAAPPPRPQQAVDLLGGTDIELLDVPPLREEDNNAGAYVAARRTGIGQTWQGARIYRSIDSGATYQSLLAIGTQAVIGTVVSAPSSGPLYRWDTEQSYVIDILSPGALESRTTEAVLNGANMSAVGADGRWHLFQFANATLIGAKRYRLSRLLLGRRGTEHMVETVQPGDTFVLLSGPGIYRLPLQSAEIGAPRLYRAVTNGAAFATGMDEPFTGQGMALRPFSPYRVRGTRDLSGDLTISWLRRDRLSPTLRDGIPTPMSEESESYKIEIMDGDTVIRTLTASTTSVQYSAADQTTDFGSPQAHIMVRIRQVSATVGDGTPVEAIV